jgi:hypothetical protein
MDFIQLVARGPLPKNFINLPTRLLIRGCMRQAVFFDIYLHNEEVSTQGSILRDLV